MPQEQVIKSSQEKTYTQDDLNKIMFAAFAKLSRQPLMDLTSNTTNSLSFKKFSKENIISYLQSPQKNEQNIRDASIYMYNNSSQYRRLIVNYALMPTWAYTIVPYKFDKSKAKSDAYLKQYTKVAQAVENMQIKHEFLKVGTVAFREDVFYGICWETTDSFFIQRINPNYCSLSSIEDGVYNFAVDMSKIKEADLILYPPEFTTMWNTYNTTGQKKQEVPSSISACFKVNEDLPYPLPIFSGTMVSLHDIEDYKALTKQRTEVGNYKMMGMTVPTNDEGTPKMLWDDVINYYNQIAGNLPDKIGSFVSPFKVESFSFDKSGGLSEANEVFDAEQAFWRSTGSSSLLFGGGTGNSSSTVKLSILSDEEIVIGFIRQVERWINRRLKSITGTVKFKINLLPITRYNQADMANLYKEAATLGLPTKAMYAATLGLNASDFEGANFIETEVLKLQDELIPLSSSYTQSNSDAGRPTNESSGKTLTESGEQTLDDDENANK